MREDSVTQTALLGADVPICFQGLSSLTSKFHCGDLLGVIC